MLSEERDVKQGQLGQKKIIKALSTGVISLLPVPSSVLIQKSRISTLPDPGALTTRPGSGVGPGGSLTQSHTKHGTFPLASSKYSLGQCHRFTSLGPHSLPMPSLREGWVSSGSWLPDSSWA